MNSYLPNTLYLLGDHNPSFKIKLTDLMYIYQTVWCCLKYSTQYCVIFIISYCLKALFTKL